MRPGPPLHVPDPCIHRGAWRRKCAMCATCCSETTRTTSASSFSASSQVGPSLPCTHRTLGGGETAARLDGRSGTGSQGREHRALSHTPAPHPRVPEPWHGSHWEQDHQASVAHAPQGTMTLRRRRRRTRDALPRLRAGTWAGCARARPSRSLRPPCWRQRSGARRRRAGRGLGFTSCKFWGNGAARCSVGAPGRACM